MDVREWYEDLNPGARKAFIGGCILALLILVSAVTSCFNEAEAVEPGQYGPADNSGHGVFINCNAADECAVFWFNHFGPGDNFWLMGVPNCERGSDTVCDVALTMPSASVFNGRPGGVEVGPSVGTLELTPMEDGSLIADWNVIALRQDECLDITPGGMIFRECIGVQTWHKIAGD